MEALRSWLQSTPMGEGLSPDLLTGMAALLFATVILLGGALAAAEESSAGVALRGVEVDLEKKVTLIAENVADGAWLDLTDKKGVVIGRRLAMTLAVKPDWQPFGSHPRVRLIPAVPQSPSGMA